MDPGLLDAVRPLLTQALAEDLATGDVTTAALFGTAPDQIQADGVIVAEEECVIAGVEVAGEVFRLVDPSAAAAPQAADGERVKPGQVVLRLRGHVSGLLTAERVALNFLQRLSGVATLTARFVEAVKGTRAKIMDTRKTTPGWRLLEKYAVRMGGGVNHRMTLADGILIKDNHIALAGGVALAVETARRHAPATLPIEVETTTLAEVEEAVRAGAPMILLDNFSVEQLREAVSLVRGRPGAGASRPVFLEASGGITLANVRVVAETGAIIEYLPAALFLLAVFGWKAARSGIRGAWAGMAGLVLSFLAAAVQQLRIAPDPARFDHNALYHVLQAVALILIYRGAAALVIPRTHHG